MVRGALRLVIDGVGLDGKVVVGEVQAMTPAVIIQLRQIQSKLNERTIGSSRPSAQTPTPVWEDPTNEGEQKIQVWRQG